MYICFFVFCCQVCEQAMVISFRFSMPRRIDSPRRCMVAGDAPNSLSKRPVPRSRCGYICIAWARSEIVCTASAPRLRQSRLANKSQLGANRCTNAHLRNDSARANRVCDAAPRSRLWVA